MTAMALCKSQTKLKFSTTRALLLIVLTVSVLMNPANCIHQSKRVVTAQTHRSAEAIIPSPPGGSKDDT